MSDQEKDIEIPVRLEWLVICGLAVKAFCLGVSLNDLCAYAIQQKIRNQS